jgi:glycosyltransferase involved in cell wall biosynthesis
MENPTISVIIPTYNRASLLSRSVRSVLQQTYPDWELLVIDDGSTDNTAEFIRSLNDKRIHYYYKKNGGVSSARNLGLAKAKGEYVAFLDSDDEWPAAYLNTLYQALRQHPTFGCAYCNRKEVYLDGTIEDAFGPERFLSGDLAINYFTKVPGVHPSASLFHKTAWENMWWDEKLKTFNDIDMFLRLSMKIRFLFVSKTYTIRNYTKNSLIYQKDRNKSANSILVYERFYHCLGGDRLIPRRIAHKKISREYRGLARQYAKDGYRAAAMKLIRKAIAYYPSDWHYYREYIKYFLLSKAMDPEPGWQMPAPLPTEITVSAAL